MKKLVLAAIVALSILASALSLSSCQSPCNCGYAQIASPGAQMETNL